MRSLGLGRETSAVRSITLYPSVNKRFSFTHVTRFHPNCPNPQFIVQVSDVTPAMTNCSQHFTRVKLCNAPSMNIGRLFLHWKRFNAILPSMALKG